MMIFIIIVIILLVAIGFFTLGFVSKELILYGIMKSKKADEKLKLAKKIIDRNKKIFPKAQHIDFEV